jgi:hypothetical protein
VARIDRQISPNQLVLWTVYELRDLMRQAVGRLRTGGSADRGRARAVGRWLVSAAARVLRMLTRARGRNSSRDCPVDGGKLGLMTADRDGC